MILADKQLKDIAAKFNGGAGLQYGRLNAASIDLTLADEAVIYRWPWYLRAAFWAASQVVKLGELDTYVRASGVAHIKTMVALATLSTLRESVGKRFGPRGFKVDLTYGRWLMPGEMALVASQDYTYIPNDAGALLTLKSSSGRAGALQAFTGYFDPGYHGQANFPVHAGQRPVWLESGDRFAQLVFINSNVPDKPYGSTGDSHYQGTTGIAQVPV